MSDASERLAVQLGCGPIRYAAPVGWRWVNVDVEPSHNPDVCVDARQLGARIAAGTADCVFSCHALEHLSPYPQAVADFLRAAFDVLEPGGVIRIVVPDLMKVARKYVAGESLRDVYDGPYHYGRDCPAERFVFFMRAWEHTIVFDEPLLASFMADAGFRDVRRMPFGVSRCEAMNGVDRFESESMSLEGIK